jgi:hypothetical protein
MTAKPAEALSKDGDDLRKLAEAFASSMMRHPTELVVGRAPDDWPAELDLPAPARVLGGMRSDRALIAVFEYPASDARDFDAVVAFLERGGWVRSAVLGSGGFESTMIMMCERGDDMLNAMRVRAHAPGSTIMMSFAPGGAAQSRPPDEFHRSFGLRIPRIAPPPGVRYDSGGGSSSDDDRTSVHVRVWSDLPSAALLPFYAAELAKAGWRLGQVKSTTTDAIQWLETDHEGRVWRGMLTVYENDGAREVFIYMASAAPDLKRPRRPGSGGARPPGR